MSLGGKAQNEISEIDNVGNSQHKQMTISILIHAIFWRTTETIFPHKQILILIYMLHNRLCL